MTNIQLIVGLGNPGTSYSLNRHNIGQMVIEQFWEEQNLQGKVQEKFKGLFTLVSTKDSQKIFGIPKTFMNLSGEFVAKVANFYKIPPSEILILHDELDVPFGQIMIKKNGGLAGHNGLKSIKAHLNTDEFLRIRIGIGRPTFQQVHEWVLSDFSKDEKMYLPKIHSSVLDALECICVSGVEKASTLYNKKSLI